MNLHDLNGKKIAIWGLGKEGRSSLKYLRGRFPAQTIALIDDHRLADDEIVEFDRFQPVTFHFNDSDPISLTDFDVVVKSPGISRYREDIVDARSKNVVFTSATNLWFEAVGDTRIIAITGTKGKSTTAALLAASLKSAGYEVALGGNIGTPLLDLLDQGRRYDFWVIELSSYQTCELEKWPEIAVLVNLFPEHVPWHGSVERYYEDKLQLFNGDETTAVINQSDANSMRYSNKWKNAIRFNNAVGFHLQECAVFDHHERLLSTTDLKLVGRHNLSNICAVLTVIRRLGIAIDRVLPAIKTFKGLAHRLEILGEKHGITYVNDSISTTPESALAAIEAFPHQPITILLGGQDRHQNFQSLVERLRRPHVANVITMYETGDRIADSIEKFYFEKGESPKIMRANELASAMAMATERTPKNGVVLLSPASPSFDAFQNFQQRGDLFCRLAGF